MSETQLEDEGEIYKSLLRNVITIWIAKHVRNIYLTMKMPRAARGRKGALLQLNYPIAYKDSSILRRRIMMTNVPVRCQASLKYQTRSLRPISEGLCE